MLVLSDDLHPEPHRVFIGPGTERERERKKKRVPGRGANVRGRIVVAGLSNFPRADDDYDRYPADGTTADDWATEVRSAAGNCTRPADDWHETPLPGGVAAARVLPWKRRYCCRRKRQQQRQPLADDNKTIHSGPTRNRQPPHTVHNTNTQ